MAVGQPAIHHLLVSAGLNQRRLRGVEFLQQLGIAFLHRQGAFADVERRAGHHHVMHPEQAEFITGHPLVDRIGVDLAFAQQVDGLFGVIDRDERQLCLALEP